MKRKREMLWMGNPKENITLFNQALGNNTMTTVSESLDYLLDDYTMEEILEACEALRDDFTSDSAMLAEFFRNDLYGKGTLSSHIIERYNILPNEFTEAQANEIIDETLLDIAEIVDKKFIEDYLKENVNESYFLTEDEDEDNFEISDDDLLVDDDTDFDDSDDNLEDIEIDDEETDNDVNLPNELISKKVKFPVLISCINDEDEPAEADEEDKKEIVDNYADAVITDFDENKKFILAALDVYDFEIYFKGLDLNSNVTFEVELDSEVKNDELIRVIKRYFDAEVDGLTTDYGILSIKPVLDLKFLVVD